MALCYFCSRKGKTVYYSVVEDGIRKVDEQRFFENKNGVCVLPLEEWQKDSRWKEKFSIWHNVDNVHYCKMESYRDFLFGTIRVPAKGEKEKPIEFALYILKDFVLVLDQDGSIVSQIEKLSREIIRKEYSLERFLYDFLQSFISNDLIFLEAIEVEIANIEEDVLQGKVEHFSYRMLQIKKLIARFYHYYSQLADIGDELLENQEGFFGEEEMQFYGRYADRVNRLAGETQLLREYAMQVQEVYQSEIGIRQNDVMKILTIVTTIFLPLSLIAGWYGMNFSYMPELQYKYAYPIVIGICLFIVLISLIIFKKKKYW